MCQHCLTKSDLKGIPFVGLHLHTTHSHQDGVGKVKEHLEEALIKGHSGLGITDHGNMGGIMELYKLSRDKEFLKKINRTNPVPIVMGAELYITDDINKRDSSYKYSHITLMAHSEEGYKNLSYLTSIASNPEHFFYRPRISMTELFKHKKGLIATTGCFLGLVPQSIVRESGNQHQLMEIFSNEFKDNFYIEIHPSDLRMKWDSKTKKHYDQGHNPQEKVNLELIELSKKFGVKCYLTQDSHMPKKEHKLIQDIMIYNSPSGKDGWHFPESYYIKSVEEMYEEVKVKAPYITDDQFLSWCKNTQEVLDKCDGIELSFSPKLPPIDYSTFNKTKTSEDTLKEQGIKFEGEAYGDLVEESKINEGLKTVLRTIIEKQKIDFSKKEYRDRLAFELDTIQLNGVIELADYFLLLSDVSTFVEENGFLRGIARGSGGGSLVAYALDITDLDPLPYGLLFERFLTKERIGGLRYDLLEKELKKLE
jgi:DNA polymerase-3 subunit alpha